MKIIKMYKRNGFVLGIVGTLAMLSFIIGVWNGIHIKPLRRPNTLGYKKEVDIQYQMQNRNSRGKIKMLINQTVFNQY